MHLSRDGFLPALRALQELQGLAGVAPADLDAFWYRFNSAHLFLGRMCLPAFSDIALSFNAFQAFEFAFNQSENIFSCIDLWFDLR